MLKYYPYWLHVHTFQVGLVFNTRSQNTILMTKRLQTRINTTRYIQINRPIWAYIGCGERRRSGLRGKELRGNAPRGNELRGNGTQPWPWH